MNEKDIDDICSYANVNIGTRIHLRYCIKEHFSNDNDTNNSDVSISEINK